MSKDVNKPEKLFSARVCWFIALANNCKILLLHFYNKFVPYHTTSRLTFTKYCN